MKLRRLPTLRNVEDKLNDAESEHEGWQKDYDA